MPGNRGEATTGDGERRVNLVGMTAVGAKAVASSIQVAREHFTDLAKLESLNLKIRAICPADLLPAVDQAVALRVVAIRRHSPRDLVMTKTETLMAATESVYRDLAAGWLPELKP